MVALLLFVRESVSTEFGRILWEITLQLLQYFQNWKQMDPRVKTHIMARRHGGFCHRPVKRAPFRQTADCAQNQNLPEHVAPFFLVIVLLSESHSPSNVWKVSQKFMDLPGWRRGVESVIQGNQKLLCLYSRPLIFFEICQTLGLFLAGLCSGQKEISTVWLV